MQQAERFRQRRSEVLGLAISTMLLVALAVVETWYLLT
jgi:hypothetical protein